MKLRHFSATSEGLPDKIGVLERARWDSNLPKLDPKSYKHFVPSIDLDFGIALVDLFRMAIVEVKDIPMWLREGLDEEATEGVLNKRSEPRHGWMILTRARLLSSPDTKLTSVKTFNVSCGGLGLITRQELDQGDELELSPMVDTGEPVHVRVVYCKQTIQGYKVGCEFVTD